MCFDFYKVSLPGQIFSNSRSKMISKNDFMTESGFHFARPRPFHVVILALISVNLYLSNIGSYFRDMKIL